MTSPVQIAHADPTPAATATIKRMHDLAAGTLVMYPTPGRGGEGIARDILHALGKCFRDRSPRDPRRLATLAALWLRAERVTDLVVAGAHRRPASEWKLLRDLCHDDGPGPRLALIVEQPVAHDQRAALGGDVMELTLDQLTARIRMGRKEVGITDEIRDEHLLYPPVPDVDFPFFPSACADLLPHSDAKRVLATFRRGRSATGLWLQLRCTIEDRHGPGPRHPHAFLDTLVAPCATVDAALARLGGAQAQFLLDGFLLEIDPDAFAVDHARHAGARATHATARILRSFLEPHLAAVGALACATRANARQITSLTIGAVERIGASLASGHRLPPAFVPLLAAHVLARQEQGADGGQPLFLAPDRMHPATARHVNSWLARVGHETGLHFERGAGWNRYTTPTWATFRHLETVQLLAIPQRQAVGHQW